MVVKRRSFVQTRKAAGYTQESLAERLGVDRTTVARWEAGEYAPQPWLRPRIAEAFGVSLRECSQLLGDVAMTGDADGASASVVGAGGALLAGSERVPAATLKHDRLSQEPGPVMAYAEGRAPQATIAPSVSEDTGRLEVPTVPAMMAGIALSGAVELAEGFATPLDYLTFLSNAARCVPGEQGDRIYDQLTQLLRHWAGVMNRRELFQLFGWTARIIGTSSVVSGLDDEERNRLARAIVAPSRLDTEIIEHLATMLRRCKQQDDVLGPRAVLHTVLAQRQLARHLLTECPARLRPRLLAVYSGMSSSVGDYCFDVNDLDSAGYYYNQARAAAHEARSVELGSYALCSMSYAASSQGKAHTGIDLATAAQSLANKSDDVLLRVCAAERAGTAYAVDGQYKKCIREFDTAQAAFVASADLASSESPAYYYHEGLLASHRSECLLLLKKPDEAVVSARSGLAVFNTSYVDGYALCTLRLGSAYLQAGEVEEAAQVIGSAASLAARNRQARLVRELRTARARMEPWQETSAVRELDERLMGVGFGG
jgi:DNA-binding XRE family transcriptional regulator/tetratricopeptide (TPR) repeat protein